MRKQVEEMVKAGKKGVTNFQMIPAMRENSEVEDLKVLFAAYPEVFRSSAKYVPDELKVVAEKIIQEVDPTFTVVTGKKIRGEKVNKRTRKEKEEVKEQLVIASEFKSDNNKKLAEIIQSTDNWKEVVGDAVEMVKLAIQDKSAAEIGLALGMSKDKVYTVLYRKNGKSILEKLINVGLTKAI